MNILLQPLAILFTILLSIHSFAAEQLSPKEMKQLQSAVEKSLIWRVHIVQEAEYLEEALNKDTALPQYYQNNIMKETREYFAQRKTLLALVDRYKPYLTDYKLKLSLTEPSGKVQRRLRKPLLVINPTDDEGQVYIKQLKLSLAAALLQYDNYLIGVFNFTQDSKVRDKINKDYPRMEDALNEVEDNFYSWSNRKLVAEAIRLYTVEQTYMLESGTEEKDPDVRYLNLLITSSPSFESMGDYSFWDTAFDRLYKRHMQRRDIYRKVKDESTNAISKVFGNTMGLVEERKGYLYGDPFLTKTIQAQLQPLDILYEKTPFRLTDTFIPGHWGHAAIWVGTENELKQIKRNGISIWDNLEAEMIYLLGPKRGVQQAASVKESIRSNKLVLEALRPGVMLNDLSHFMNIDDFAVSRRSEEFKLTDEQKYNYLVLAFLQVGKDYDFNFDVDTDDKIVCSELIYKVYPDDDWPVAETLNRWTISPDNVADLSVKPVDGQLMYDVPVLYSKGRQILGDSEAKRNAMEQLLLYSYNADIF